VKTDACRCDRGWVCEDHPDRPLRHTDVNIVCEATGMRCPNVDCAWWVGNEPPALGLDLSFVHDAAIKPFRVVQPFGPHLDTESSVLAAFATPVGAFSFIDATADQMRRTGAPSDAIELVVLDVDGRRVTRSNAH
jgi:hypothetical protein